MKITTTYPGQSTRTCEAPEHLVAQWVKAARGDRLLVLPFVEFVFEDDAEGERLIQASKQADMLEMITREPRVYNA